jgi:metal-responsive CopG/Arc/MetJ family transcriptional regulator
MGGSLSCNTRTVRTAVSLPDDLYARAEGAAQRLGRTRSALYADVLREYLDRHESEQAVVTARLDEVYADEAVPADAGADVGRRLIGYGAWT